MPVDSPPYTSTTPTFFPIHFQDTGPSSPQYLGPSSLQYSLSTSQEYFSSSLAYSPTDLSDLLIELFAFSDSLAGVKGVEPLVDLVEPLVDLVEPLVEPHVDLVEPLVELEEVIEPPRKRRRRKRRIRYP